MRQNPFALLDDSIVPPILTDTAPSELHSERQEEKKEDGARQEKKKNEMKECYRFKIHEEEQKHCRTA